MSHQAPLPEASVYRMLKVHGLPTTPSQLWQIDFNYSDIADIIALALKTSCSPAKPQ